MDLVLESSLPKQSVCSSKNITHIIGKSITVAMIVYYKLEGKITLGYWCITHLASGNKSDALKSIDYLIDRSSGCIGCIIQCHEIICAKICDINKLILKNGNKAIAHRKIQKDYNARINPCEYNYRFLS